MRGGGDIFAKKSAGAGGSGPEKPDRLLTATDSDLTGGKQDLYVEGRPPAEPTIMGRFFGLFGNLAQKLFPDFFGIFGRIRTLPPDYANFTQVLFDSGAQLFYEVRGEEIMLAGSLYDLASFTHKLLNDPEKKWSMGAVVDVIRKGEKSFESRHIGPAVYDNLRGLYKILIGTDRDVSFDSFQSRFLGVTASLDNLKEYEIEESAAGLKFSDVIEALQKALRGVRPRYAADVEMLLPIGVDNGSFDPENIGRVDAGVRLGPDGKITAITLRIREGERIAERFGAPFLFENESLWIGRIKGKNGKMILWEIENSNPSKVDKEMNTALLSDISRLFRSDVVHVLKKNGQTNGGGMSGGNMPSAGGGGPITSAGTTAADEEVVAGETGEGTNEAMNCGGAGYGNGILGTSLGVFTGGGFVFGLVPVI